MAGSFTLATPHRPPRTQSEVTEAFVRVIGDLSRMPRADFWRHMAARGCLHPFDQNGERIHPSALPSAIRHLKRDAHRDLAWSDRCVHIHNDNGSNGN